MIALSLPWLLSLRRSSERKGKKKKKEERYSITVQPVQFIWSKETCFLSVSTNVQTLLDPEIQHRRGTLVPPASLSQEVAESFAAQLLQRRAAGDGAGAC